MTQRDHGGVTRRRTRLEAHGHRGARGLRPENTLPGFAHALEIGIDAVELDVGLTCDGTVVVNHDQVLSAVTCCDTGAAWPGDPGFPYVGRRIRDLTLAQVRTVDAGVRRADDGDPFVLTQLPIPGTRLPTLAEVCRLVELYDTPALALAVEIKTDPAWPDAEVELFVRAVTEVLEAHGLVTRSRLLAFDWRVLPLARALAPEADRVALAEHRTLEPGSGWTAGAPSPATRLAAAARTAGATVLSPHHSLVTPALIDGARAEGLPVTVWTVNDPGEMGRLIELGADAIVTDYPDRLHSVMRALGLPLPRTARRRRPSVRT